MNKKVAIIGGGITGLSLAYFLSRKKYKVTLFEKEKYLGGFLSSFKLSNGPLAEKFYHHFFRKDKELLTLFRDLGLERDVVFNKYKTSIFKNKKFFPYSGIGDYLFYSNISFFNKLKMGIGGLIFSLKNLSRIEKLTSEAAIKKYLGESAWQEIWGPLLEKKFSDYYQQVSASWFWWRIRTNFSSRGELGYLKGGFNRLVDRLCAEIIKNKGVIKTEMEVTLLDRANFEIDKERFDFVINTSSSLANEKIDYLGVINLVLEMENKQTDYYWNNILDENIPFVGIIEHTNFIDKSNYQGSHLLYLTQYVAHNSEWMTKSENEVIDEYKKYFRGVGVSQNDIIKINFFRGEYAQPVIPINYTKPDQKIEVDNFYNLTQSSIYPEDRGLNQAIKVARVLIDKHFA